MDAKKAMRALAALALCLMTALLPVARATDTPTPAYYRDAEVTIGVVTAEMRVNVRSGPSTNSAIVTHVDPGDVVKVLDMSNEEWFKISVGGNVGYVLASLLQTETFMDQIEVINEDPLEVTIDGLETPDVLERHASFTLRGTVNSNVPMTSVEVDIIDLRSMETIATAVRNFEREENMTSFNLAELDSDLPFSRLDAGEKKLTLFVTSASDALTVFEQEFYVAGRTGATVSMTGDCTISSSCGHASYTADNSYNTAWYAETETDTLTIDLPEGRTGAMLLLQWVTPPSSFDLVLRDEANHTFQTINETNESGMLVFTYELTDQTRSIVLASRDADAGLGEVMVLEKGNVSPLTQMWQPLPEKVDIMVFAAHTGDEFVYYGGTIPYYAAQGKTIAVVYMTDGGRDRQAEALDAVWTAGVKYHPIFLGFEEATSRSYETVVGLWGVDTTEERVVELIRRYKPDVVIAPDIEGEGGDNLRKLTSYIIRRAVMLGVDEESYPASFERYGLWDPKKTYVHLYEGNALTMSVYDEPMEQLGGMSPTSAAALAYGKYDSRGVSFDRSGSAYDNRLFGLIRTIVGDDRLKNDLMENIG